MLINLDFKTKMNAPFFRHKMSEESRACTFSRALYWFKYWEPMIIYDKFDAYENVSWLLHSLNCVFPKSVIVRFLDDSVDCTEIDSPEKYILYKICKVFVRGESIDTWRSIQQMNFRFRIQAIRTDSMDWLASDDDHIFWITMNILNGFGDINPYRLHEWEFWSILCFLSQNPHASEKLDVYTDKNAKSLRKYPCSPRC